MSLFLTTRVDGVLEVTSPSYLHLFPHLIFFDNTSTPFCVPVWDFLYKQSGPIVPVKVADYPLLTMKIEDRGRLVATGAGDGSTSILELEVQGEGRRAGRHLLGSPGEQQQVGQEQRQRHV